MDKDDNRNKLDALKRRRELLASLAARRRSNILSSSTPKQCQEKNTAKTTYENAKQASSARSNSSDIIEDSDIENHYRENIDENLVVNSSGNSNDSCNTSTFNLPLSHPFFDINAPVFRSPTVLDLIDKSEIDMPPDSQRLQALPKTKTCVIEATCQDTNLNDVALASPINVMQVSPEGMLGAELENTRQNSEQIIPTTETDVNINSCREKQSLTESTKTSLTDDIISSINTSQSPNIQNTAGSMQTNILHFDTNIDDQINSPPVMHENSIPPNEQPAVLFPHINDPIDMYESMPGPSCENRNFGQINDTPEGRKRFFRQKINKAHVDFLSDEEQKDFSAGSSDSWTNHESDTSSDDTKQKKRKKKTKKRKVADKEVKDKEAATLIKKKEKRGNVNKLRKRNKAEGKPYGTKTGVTIEENKMKENPCIENKCVKRCFEITEERRKSIFNHFWNLDSQRRRDWILRCIQKVAIKKKRTSTPDSRRNATYEYFINDGEDHRKVCQKFLMHTLDITQIYLIYTIQNSEESMAKQDMRKPNVPQKYSEAIKKYVVEFIEKLPVLPSHYNRPKSDRMYLPQEYKSTMHIYRNYLKDCQINGYQPVGESIFRQIFNEYNISIHVPKKDKCKICTQFENDKKTTTDDCNIESAMDEKLQAHLKEKNATYRRFQSQQNIKSNDTITASFDLQKVLNTPYGESMLLYYSRKYAVYNFTFYESGTQDAFCFTWGESDGKRGSNEIAICLLKYLKDVDSRGVKNLLLYCDSCSGQNKNKTVLTALNLFLKTSNNLEVIQINFLLPGHTYMPVDSVHAVIEREVKKLIVWSPSQWATYFQSARKNPRPYRVEVLDHTDFLDFKGLAEQEFTPTVLRKLRIQQVRTVTFKKKYPDQIKVKYSMTEEAEEIQVTLHEGDPKAKGVKGKGKGTEKTKSTYKGKGKGKGKSKASTDNMQDTVESVHDTRQDIPGPIITRAYNARLPLSKAKYKDLMRLCDNGTIPKNYHDEYRRIPCEETVCDYFPHSDHEENQEINEG